MTNPVGPFEAKAHLSELLQRVEYGEHITITKHGRVVARLIPGIEQEPETNWSQFWERADSRLVILSHGSSIKTDIEFGRD